MILRAIGAQVAMAENGVVALRQIAEEKPDIVFMDISMPVMDGPEALEKIVSEYGQNAPPVVAVTASVLEHQRKDFMKLGFARFIDKPVQATTIYRCLTEELGVQYDHTDAAPSEEKEWSTLSLPPAVHEELAAAVRKQSVTQLKRLIGELAELGDRERALAHHLRELTVQFNLAAIRSTLDGIRVL